MIGAIVTAIFEGIVEFILTSILQGVGWLLKAMGLKARDAAVQYVQEREARAQTYERLAAEPATSLLRAGTGPTTPQNELMRPASASDETRAQELLRAAGNE